VDLGQPALFSGATIMGDGRVALILDVRAVGQLGGVTAAEVPPPGDGPGPAAAEQDAARSLLLLRVGPTGRVALPLSAVARLDEIARSAVEQCGGREVVQHHGAVLPLVRLAPVLQLAPDPEAELLQVVVHRTADDQTVGLVVDEILDVVELVLDQDRSSGPRELVRPVVVDGLVTSLLDVQALVAGVLPLTGAVR
jgi:two-component system, chemotaxis family, sensor kinase CheA